MQIPANYQECSPAFGFTLTCKKHSKALNYMGQNKAYQKLKRVIKIKTKSMAGEVQFRDTVRDNFMQDKNLHVKIAFIEKNGKNGRTYLQDTYDKHIYLPELLNEKVNDAVRIIVEKVADVIALRNSQVGYGALNKAQQLLKNL